MQTLFQSIQALEGLQSKFATFSEQVDSQPSMEIVELIKPIFTCQKSIMYEMERHIASKVDRIEFS